MTDLCEICHSEPASTEEARLIQRTGRCSECAQWERDHFGGEISAEEWAAMRDYFEEVEIEPISWWLEDI